MPMFNDYSQPIILAILSAVNAAHHSDPNSRPSLTLSGEPAALAKPTTFYAFTPTVFRNGDTNLKFSIQNKPAWASFGRVHGTLYGVPAAGDVGTYADILITVTDGVTIAHLRAFTVQVVAPPPPAAKAGKL